ncbi:uncharacterized protein LOC109533085 isoform X2 [Dendroctonus ponderosae]|uniref:SCP domain-containing protein n=1 Tax=Dendroctonus ponderosae TaxID=77166 RepID=A0AAR5P037_DENPD|nr:uncharacterized protein LOC109533085 isoform X2 [Dendroctonus ponderosae]XP_019753870.1 uncharacterized protein LOC109533085 isoform X2 [Dendroctonus ponderosae]XP_019753871.1 uncharacterized protein LOC109533085 isoform X2 [Dendroctonus ponderosae]XP_048519170.1 uncharacterized protein LOC125502292 isoform X2 [Dendroctonus ponderosae]XP_048519171.1 uncharacterized protein LOC125502292 isoform X2 [Dendroctonus ponderosae]XP_048519172.1 uncharacterized protein LOC125502292 isoform X2 [Dendro
MESARRKSTFPGSLTDLHRFRKTAHGHDGSSRIVMVRKTDQRTFASMKNGEEPTLETVTRETIETFRGQRTECKVTTEKKDFEHKCHPDIARALAEKITRSPNKPTSIKKPLHRKMDFQTECLQAHNEYRRKHGVPPLKLDKEICKFSQQWADHLIRKGALVHSNNRDYGENIFMMQSSNPNFTVSGRKAVESWYDEIKLHKFGMEPQSLASGHFTQVIWKESKQLGVAFAKMGGKVVVVANYYPPGNMIGSFDENVPPPGGLSPSYNNNNNNTIELPTQLGRLSLSSKSSTRDLRSVTEGDFEDDFLNAHNKYRKRHGVPPLKLDKSLCKYAEEWAKHLASKNILEHRPESNYGENIYCLYTSDPSFRVNGNTPVDNWYEEIKDHPFSREPSTLKSGHFTQVIWKSSESLGVGVAKSSQGSIYVVANYSPAGNFVGHYVENCPPLKPTFYDSIPDMAQNAAQAASDPKQKNDELDIRSFAKDALQVHNEYRRKHGVPQLVLNYEISKYAQEWAETCARTTSLQHRANNQYGENIFSMYSSDYSYVPTARDAVKEWYDEIKKHSYNRSRVPQESLHFTQIIWKDSKELGVGIAKNAKGQTYVVCNYHPKGNYVGQFDENVPKPLP